MSRGCRFDVPGTRGGRCLRELDGTRIGASILGHTMDDREQALEALKVGFDQTYAETGRQIGVLPYEGSAERLKQHPERAPQLLWWQSVAVPVFNRWTDFHAEQSGKGRTGPLPGYVAYGEKFSTDWSTYEDWSKQLESLRDSARKMGLKLSDIKVNLPTTIYEDVGNKVSDIGGEVHSLVKIAVIGGLVLGGTWAVVEIVKSARSR